MEVTALQQQILNAHRRFADAQWRLKMENKRTDENVKWIISHSQQLHEYQEILEDITETWKEKAEKLRLVYKRLELRGQIEFIKEGLKKARELTSSAEEKVNKVGQEIEKMNEERWEIGVVDERENDLFVIKESPVDGIEDYLESPRPLTQDEIEYQELILERIDDANTRIKIANEKCASLQLRKRKIIEEIENYKNRKRDAIKARQSLKEKDQNANLKLYFVEFGII